MNIKLDTEVYKIKDPRIQRVMHGAMSLEQFVASINANDPFVLVHDTVYAMTEQEWYSTRAVYPQHSMMDHMFDLLMHREDLSMFAEADRKKIEQVREKYPTCPSCQKKRYRKLIYQIGIRYKDLRLELNDCLEMMNTIPRYPDVSSPVKPILSLLLPDLHDVPPIQRKGCIACVEKHLSQAYILAGETVMGYPEHLVLVVGHLNEAISELPDEAFTMKQTLEFCAAKSVESGRAVVPLWAILSQLLWVRKSMEDTKSEEPIMDEPVYDVGLDLTDEMKDDYDVIDPFMRKEFLRRLEDIDKLVQDYKEKPEERKRFQFSGLMASIAELVSQVAPKLANMLRDRRLAFTASPDLMDEAGYSMKALKEQLNSGLSVNSDSVVEQRVADNAALGVL